MAITKVMNMKASAKARIDIHLEHAIDYILQPKKLGNANLVGGINCLPDMAYEQMKATKQLFGKPGGRQGYHFVISLKPGEGTPEIMYDIGMRFAKEAFEEEYEAVVAVHTDRDHLHAHVIINSVNMVTGYKFQYHEGDWKYKFQPITNRLCEEYGLHITPAEYSREPKNVSRLQWEREKVFSEWIRQDALFCAINAESMEHFIFLLEKAGFEVKQGKHIAVKVPGMKRFKRLDTISEDFSRENLEVLFKYGEPENTVPIMHTKTIPIVRKPILSSYQKKCYTRLYRLRLADKKKFTYKSAYLYEQIRKMHELQEEYLVVVQYDVKSFVDLFQLKQRLEAVDEELSKAQKELYRERGMLKRSCKTVEDFAFFEASEDDYRNRLEQIKLQKKDNHKKLKAVERCVGRDGSLLEAELELRVPADEMELLNDVDSIRDVDVPKNPYEIQERERLPVVVEEVPAVTVTAEVADTADVTIDEVMQKVSSTISKEYAAEDEFGKTAAKQEVQESYGKQQMELPESKETYLRMPVVERVSCYPFESHDIQDIYDMIYKYFKKVGLDADFESVWNEVELLKGYYDNQKLEQIIDERVGQAVDKLKWMDFEANKLNEYPIWLLAEVFEFTDMDYYAGMKVFDKTLETLGVKMSQNKRYELYDKIYDESIKERKQVYDKSRNSR